MGDISIFENKTFFQAKQWLLLLLLLQNVSQTIIKNILNNERITEFFFTRKLLILHALDYQGIKFQVV